MTDHLTKTLAESLRSYVEDYKSEDGLYDAKHYARRFNEALALFDAAQQAARCDCGKKLTSDCEKWEPGCHLGTDSAHAKVFPLGHLMDAAVKQAAGEQALRDIECPPDPETVERAIADEMLPSDKHIKELAHDLGRQAMEQAQVFASAWSLVGGQFDTGNGMDDAEEAKDDLRTLIQALADLAAETVRPCARAAQAAQPAPEAQQASEPAFTLPSDNFVWRRIAARIAEAGLQETVELNEAMHKLADDVIAAVLPTAKQPAQAVPLTIPAICDLVGEADLDWQKGWPADPCEVNRFLRLGRLVERACAEAWGVKLAGGGEGGNVA